MTPESAFTALLQVELLASALPTARTFYESVLGLMPPDRPALPYTRECYALNGHQQ